MNLQESRPRGDGSPFSIHYSLLTTRSKAADHLREIPRPADQRGSPALPRRRDGGVHRHGAVAPGEPEHLPDLAGSDHGRRAPPAPRRGRQRPGAALGARQPLPGVHLDPGWKPPGLADRACRRSHHPDYQPGEWHQRLPVGPGRPVAVRHQRRQMAGGRPGDRPAQWRVPHPGQDLERALLSALE